MLDNLSVVIITKNSAHTLERTLRSVQQVGEVVVYDNGSIDRTLEIARSFPNVKVHTGEFFGFGPTKNHAVSLAVHDWVFPLDSDEVFTEELARELAQFSPAGPQVAYQVLRHNYLMGKRIRFGGWGGDWLVRLYNRREFRFTDSMVHEKVELGPRARTVRLRAPIEHYAVEEIRQLLEKVNLYSEIRKDTSDRALHPILVVIRSIFTFFKSYLFQLGFVEGWRGLVIAVYNSISVFFKYMKIYAKLKQQRAMEKAESGDEEPAPKKPVWGSPAADGFARVCHVNLARFYRGGERQTEMLVKTLAKQGLKQRAVLRHGSPLTVKLQAVTGVEVIEISGPLVLSGRVCAGVDLIHAHEARAAHLALFNHWFTGLPYLITRRVPNPPGYDPLTKRVYHQAVKIVALSRAIRGVVLQYDPELDVRIIPSMFSRLPVDEATAGAIRARYKGKFVAGHIGALQMRHKGQQYLIQAARDLSKSHPDIHFLFLGEGEDEQPLKRLAAGLENVEFLGFRENVGDYLSLFDLFVFPSLKEGLGSILLDAMEYGKAIIASDVDGIREIVKHDENGLLMPVGDAETLKASMLELYGDEARRRRLGKRAQEFVTDYSPETTAGAYTRLYREILGGQSTVATKCS